MINNPEIIEKIKQDIKNTSKEDLDKAIQKTNEEFEEDKK